MTDVSAKRVWSHIPTLPLSSPNRMCCLCSRQEVLKRWLIHSIPLQNRQRWRWAPERGEQPQHPKTMMTGQPSTHNKSTSKTDDNDEDDLKLLRFAVKKNSTHDDDGTNQHSPHVVDHGSLLLTMIPVPTSIHRPMPALRHNHPTSAAPYKKPPFLQCREIVQTLQCRGYPGIRSSEWIWVYGVGASVLSWRPRVWCSRTGAVYAGESSTNSTHECTLILFCRYDGAKLSGIRRWGLLSHSTIEVRSSWMITTKSSEIGW